MSTIVTIQSSDIIANSRADINTNFSNLNTDKADKTTTVNGKALSTNPVLGLASSDFANQGTATTVLHGNGSGNPAFSAVVETDQTLSDLTTNDVTSTKHGYAPKSPADATKFLNGAATPVFAQVKDSDLSTSDVTTNNVSTSKHGFVPKAPNDSTKYLDGTGAYSSPVSGKQIWIMRNVQATPDTNSAGNSATYSAGNVTNGEFVCPFSGFLRNFYVYISANTLSSNAVFTVQVNSADTALTFTKASGFTGSGSDVTHSVAVSAGDLVRFENGNSPGGTSVSMKSWAVELTES